jgi:hypothetical protein
MFSTTKVDYGAKHCTPLGLDGVSKGALLQTLGPAGLGAPHWNYITQKGIRRSRYAMRAESRDLLCVRA